MNTTAHIPLTEMFSILNKRYRKAAFKPKIVNINGEDVGAIKIAATATNNVDVPLFVAPGKHQYYDEKGVQLKFKTLLNSYGWHVDHLDTTTGYFIIMKNK